LATPFEPVVLLLNALRPFAVLLLPVVFDCNEPLPRALLLLPLVLVPSEPTHIAVLKYPLLKRNAYAPFAVFSFHTVLE
jgi:hypothetical protein